MTTPSNRARSASATCNNGRIDSHTVRHPVPSWRRIPFTEACSRRICSIAHRHALVVNDERAQGPAFRQEMAGWIAEGAVTYKEDIVAGLENAPEAFIGLLEGRNFGKLIVKL